MPTQLLTPAHLQHLRQSAISDLIIDERGYRSISSKVDWKALQPFLSLSRGARDYRGIAFPIYRLGQIPPDHWMLRPDFPRSSKGKIIKYEAPSGGQNCFDVLPRYQQALGDPSIPIWITEGAKKADALATAYDQCIVPINLNGVWGFRGITTKGRRIVSPDFHSIAWNGREIVIAFDSDVIRKQPVWAAVEQLAQLLGARGAAIIRVLMLPDDPQQKLGVDDYLAQGHTTAELESHLAPLWAGQASVRMRLVLHPKTGADLFLPPGYAVINQQIFRTNNHSSSPGRPIYPGPLIVTSTGYDLDSGTELFTVAFPNQSTWRYVSAPRAELARQGRH
jgi:hypothetical protein